MVHFETATRSVAALAQGGRDTIRWEALTWRPTEIGVYRARICVNPDAASFPESMLENNCNYGVIFIRSAAAQSGTSSSRSSTSSQSSASSSASSRSSRSGQSSAAPARMTQSADLVVTSLTLSPNPIRLSGQGAVVYRFVAMVKNVGAGRIGPTFTRLDIQSEDGLTGNDENPWSVRTAALPPGRVKRVLFRSPGRGSWLPMEGSFFATACANDELRDITAEEADYDNNCSDELAFSVVGSNGSQSSARSSTSSARSSSASSESADDQLDLPDLDIASITVQAGNPGEVMVSAAVRARRGRVPVPTTAAVDYSTDRSGPWLPATPHDRSVSPIDRAGMYQVVSWFSLRSASGEPFPADTYYFRVCADAPNELEEFVESNNCSPPQMITLNSSASSTAPASGSSSSQASSASAWSTSSSSQASSASASPANAAPAATSLPDFTLASIGHSPATLTVGNAYKFSAVATNIGAAWRQTDAPLKFRLDIKDLSGADAPYYSGVLRLLPALGTNERVNVTWTSIDVPASMLPVWVPHPGQYAVRICVNLGNPPPIAEQNALNNCLTETVTVVAASSSSAPASSSSSVSSATSSAASASSVSSVSLPDIRIYSFTVQPGNPGEAMVSAAARILFYAGASVPNVSTVMTVQYRPEGSDTWTTTGAPRTLPPLIRSGQYEVADWFALVMPSGARFQPGVYYFRACSDTTNVVPESVETNNCGAGFSVTIR